MFNFLAGGYLKWKNGFLYVCLPITLAVTAKVFYPIVKGEHPERPPFVEYDYLRIRTKVRRGTPVFQMYHGIGPIYPKPISST